MWSIIANDSWITQTKLNGNDYLQTNLTWEHQKQKTKSIKSY